MDMKAIHFMIITKQHLRAQYTKVEQNIFKW